MSLHFHDSLFADFSFAQGKSIRCLCFAQLRTSFRPSTVCLKIALTVGAGLFFSLWASLTFHSPAFGYPLTLHDNLVVEVKHLAGRKMLTWTRLRV
jgi:hypothetical protein